MVNTDVVVIGSGPAALSLAAESGSQGLKTLLVAPRPERAWRASDGLWSDELPGLVDPDTVEASWMAPEVLFDGGIRRLLDRRFARLDSARLQSRLGLLARRHGVDFLDDAVRGVTHDDTGSMVHLRSGASLRGRLVVDASGALSPFVALEDGPPPVYQAAYGQLVEVEGHPWLVGEMVYMDHRSVPGIDQGKGFSFLQVMPLGAGRIFVREVALASPVPLETTELRHRLERRLREQGILRTRLLGEERLHLPVATPPPQTGQRVLALGAAAGMAHPATGSTLARTLQRAPVLARALAQGLSGGDLGAAARLAWGAVWSPDERRAHALHAFAVAALGQLPHGDVHAFLDAFFQLPVNAWSGFLSASASAAETARTLSEVLDPIPAPSRARLLDQLPTMPDGPRRRDTASPVEP